MRKLRHTSDQEGAGPFFGWVIVAASFLMMVVLGAVFYGFGIFFNSLESDFGWSRALTSSVQTVFVLAVAISTYGMGMLADRYGTRKIVALSAFLIGLGLALCSQMHSISQFYLLYIMAGLGTGVTWSVPTAAVQRWFIKRRGLVLGLTVAGVGVGTLLFAPLLSYCIEVYGWRTTYIILGTISWALLCIAALTMVQRPEQRGLRPYGAEVVTADQNLGAEPRLWSPEQWSVSEALRTKAFYGLCLIYISSVLPIQIIAVHLIPYATDQGISRVAAAGALGLVGGISIPGRIIGGALSDKLGWSNSIALFCGLTAIVVLGFAGVGRIWMLYLWVLFYGFIYGARVPQIPGLAGFYFGTKSLVVIIGLSHGIATLFGAFGPLIAGFIFDKTGSYMMAFVIAAVLSFIAMALALAVKPPLRES